MVFALYLLMKRKITHMKKYLHKDIKPYNLPVTEPVLHTIRTARGSFFIYAKKNR